MADGLETSESGLGPIGSGLLSLWGPSMLDDSMRALSSMLERQQINIASQQAGSRASPDPLAKLFENLVVATRGGGLSAQERQSIRTETLEIAATLTPHLASGASIPFIRNLMASSGLDIGLGMEGALLAPAAFQAMKGLPGMAMSLTHGEQAGAFATSIAQQMRLPSGAANLSFTGGLGPIGVGGVMEFLGNRGMLPSGREDMFSTIGQFNQIAGQMQSSLGVPGAQSLGIIDAALMGGGAGLSAQQFQGVATGIRVAQQLGMPPDQSMALMHASAGRAAAAGLPPAFGADAVTQLFPAAFGAVEARAGKPFFGMLSASQLTNAMDVSTTRGLKSPFAVAAGGFLQAVSAAGQLAGMDVERLGPTEVLRGLGADENLTDIASALEHGNVTAGTIAQVTNTSELSQQLAANLGLNQGTVGGMLTTPTTESLNWLQRVGGKSLMAVAQQAYIVDALIMPEMLGALSDAGIARGERSELAGELFAAFKDQNVSNVKGAKRVAEEVLGAGHGQVGVDAFLRMQTRLADPAVADVTGGSLREFMGLISGTRETREERQNQLQELSGEAGQPGSDSAVTLHKRETKEVIAKQDGSLVEESETSVTEQS